MMRLLLSSHGASPYGAERVLLVLAQGLRDRGHDVVLEFPHEGPAVDEARALPGIRVWVSGRPRLPRNAREAAYYLMMALPATVRLGRQIRAGGFDVVWVNSLFNPLAAVAARQARAPIVWHLHERNFRGAGRFAGALAVRFGCDVPVGVSRFVADTFPDGPGRFRVLRNAEFRGFSACPCPAEPEGFVAGYLGQLEPRKRVADLVDALAQTADARGLIVGDGKRRKDIERAVSLNRLTDRVEIAGFRTDVAACLARMTCVVIPSRDEPCPLVALEALATGRPVVASDHGSHREVLGDAALYFPLGDARALAAQLTRLRDDQGLRMLLRERGLERLRGFGVEGWLDGAEEIARETARLRTP